MRKLIAQQWVTLDDIVAEEDGGLGFVTPLPFDDAHPTPFQDRIMAMIDSVDTLILGANTYRQSTGWPVHRLGGRDRPGQVRAETERAHQVRRLHHDGRSALGSLPSRDHPRRSAGDRE
ncbi:hypothetical protein [Microbacterium xylanilyticum]